jgi:DNA polymerase III delta subunit
MQSMGLFVEKRLFVFYFSLEKKKDPDNKKKESAKKKEEKQNDHESRLLRILKSIDTDTFVIIVWKKSPTGELYSWCQSFADHRSYDAPLDIGTWSRRYPDLDTETIREVIRISQSSISDDDTREISITYDIRASLEKLSLLALSKNIEKADIELSLERGGSPKIFELIDTILRADRKNALKLLTKTLSESSVYGFLPSFISLMRSSVYVRFLKYHGKNESTIATITKSHPFVVKKAYNSTISWESLREFYIKLIDVSIAYKSGK